MVLLVHLKIATTGELSVKIHILFLFLLIKGEAGAPDAPSGINDDANQWHSAPMTGSMSHLPPTLPLRWERKKGSQNVECSLL